MTQPIAPPPSEHPVPPAPPSPEEVIRLRLHAEAATVLVCWAFIVGVVVVMIPLAMRLPLLVSCLVGAAVGAWLAHTKTQLQLYRELQRAEQSGTFAALVQPDPDPELAPAWQLLCARKRAAEVARLVALASVLLVCFADLMIIRLGVVTALVAAFHLTLLLSTKVGAWLNHVSEPPSPTSRLEA